MLVASSMTGSSLSSSCRFPLFLPFSLVYQVLFVCFHLDSHLFLASVVFPLASSSAPRQLIFFFYDTGPGTKLLPSRLTGSLWHISGNSVKLRTQNHHSIYLN
ncbi:hypothetical protein BpHYR1_006820 [Brachionus plicatilis]|uniref:Uncharacterized protein n=1 Tax=Brachionus plicatilis TaxID=10195 RepID=A0A3M7SC60_BRAPC|nr:hypothetical protein BpHYR1_006820 [Brachionus plicatilis]